MDYFVGERETDDGIANTHGNSVFQSALSVSSVYDVVDLKIGSPSIAAVPEILVEQALDDAIAAVDNGAHIGAINMSFSFTTYPSRFIDEINELATRGVLTVAAVGNAGSHASWEFANYPAALSSVIAVGSHDGRGNPSAFSQNGPSVDVLADGEDMPELGSNGTSFAAPRLAATVTHVQAIAVGLTGRAFSVEQMIDTLQQGGTGPRAQADPGATYYRYFLHDHDGSLNYAWYKNGGNPTTALEYVASHGDLMRAFGVNPDAGRLHFVNFGAIEERGITFDGLEYVASYGDLARAFGASAYAGVSHYIASGRHEGRQVTFDGLEYIASYGDLIAALGANQDAGSAHFIRNGRLEGRGTSFDGLEYIASHGDLIGAFGVNSDAGSAHFILHGRGEGRATTFDGLQYIASHGDLIRAFGANGDAGSVHFIGCGYGEGRAADTFNAAQYLANYGDLRAAFGTNQEAATSHFVTRGFYEGRIDEPTGGSAFALAQAAELNPDVIQTDFLL